MKVVFYNVGLMDYHLRSLFFEFLSQSVVILS